MKTKLVDRVLGRAPEVLPDDLSPWKRNSAGSPNPASATARGSGPRKRWASRVSPSEYSRNPRIASSSRWAGTAPAHGPVCGDTVNAVWRPALGTHLGLTLSRFKTKTPDLRLSHKPRS